MEPVAAALIDGRAIAAQVRGEVKEQAAELPVLPGLGVLLVGERKDSQTYVRMKRRAAEEVGFLSVDVTLRETASQDEILAALDALVAREDIHAVLVQLPLPDHVDEAAVLKHVPVHKDVDGFSALNIGNLCLRGGEPPLAIACTPAGCIELLQRSGVNCSGKQAVVIGRSNIVGMPVAHLLLSMDATVTICHSRTRDIQDIVKQADIVIAAVGRARYVKGEWIKPGAIVIDVGINSVPDASSKRGYALVGDVDFESASKVAGMITPVPGGVGPMTIAMLLKNTLNLTRHSLGLPRVPLRPPNAHLRDRDVDVQSHIAPVTVAHGGSSSAGPTTSAGAGAP